MSIAGWFNISETRRCCINELSSTKNAPNLISQLKAVIVCMKQWTYAPHSDGSKIPPKIYEEICKQVDTFASTRPWYPDIQLKVRFKGQFCYIDTLEKRDEDDRLFPLCRLRHLSRGWSMALFKLG